MLGFGHRASPTDAKVFVMRTIRMGFKCVCLCVFFSLLTKRTPLVWFSTDYNVVFSVVIFISCVFSWLVLRWFVHLARPVKLPAVLFIKVFHYSNYLLYACMHAISIWCLSLYFAIVLYNEVEFCSLALLEKLYFHSFLRTV